MRKRVAFVGGSGAFQPEIACHKIKSFWILLASKVSEVKQQDACKEKWHTPAEPTGGEAEPSA